MCILFLCKIRGEVTSTTLAHCNCLNDTFLGLYLCKSLIQGQYTLWDIKCAYKGPRVCSASPQRVIDRDPLQNRKRRVPWVKTPLQMFMQPENCGNYKNKPNLWYLPNKKAYRHSNSWREYEVWEQHELSSQRAKCKSNNPRAPQMLIWQRGWALEGRPCLWLWGEPIPMWGMSALGPQQWHFLGKAVAYIPGLGSATATPPQTCWCLPPAQDFTPGIKKWKYWSANTQTLVYLNIFF